MFGIEPRVGLASTVVPPNMLSNIRTEEELDTIFQNEAKGGSDEELEEEEKQDGGEVPQLGNWLQPAKKIPQLE